MSKKLKYPYPIPEFIAHLETMQEEMAPESEDPYLLLARLLHVCHATIENANALWRAGSFTGEEPNLAAGVCASFWL